MINELWGITSYFNPEQYKSKYKNYRAFRTSTRKQGLPLIVVECAFGDTPFELSQDDADILVQVRCSSVLWQKERLLNIALEHLPKECTKVAWLDADILFLNDNWISETTSLLDTYKVVQLFDTAVRLKKNQKFTKIEDFKEGCANGKKRNGYVYQKIRDPNNKYYPVTGFGWAIRRGIIEKFGFYDKMILGGGDSVMLKAIYDQSFRYEDVYNYFLDADIALWIQKISHLIQNNTSYVSGIALHLFHGEIENRLYGNRYTLIKDFYFNPSTDLKSNKDGCWEWNLDKPELQKIIREYFWSRDEDISKIKKIVLYIQRKWKNFVQNPSSEIKEYIKSTPFLYKVCVFIYYTLCKVQIKFLKITGFLRDKILKSFYSLHYRNDSQKIIKRHVSDRDDITIVIGIKNKPTYFLKNAFKSIRNQDYNQSLIDIILVDYESLPDFSQEYQKICSEFDTQYIYVENAQVWNRSHCLNIGIKKVGTKFLLSSDVDIIFEKNYITEVIKTLKQNPKQVVVSKMLDSPEGLIDEDINIILDYEFIKSRSVYRAILKNVKEDTFLYGQSINCAYTAFYKFIHGYDESYLFWGCEDKDIIKRFTLLGLKMKDISLQTSYIHQWHPIVDYTNSDSRAHKEYLMNQKYFQSHHTVVRNRENWGEVRPYRVHLISCIGVDFDYDYITHFIQYYKQFEIDSFNFILQTNINNENMLNKSRSLIATLLPQANIRVWRGEFFAEPKAAHINIFIKETFNDWHLVVDMDEFVEFNNHSIRDTLVMHDSDVFWGKFCDHAAEDGEPKKLQEDKDIFEQFPQVVEYSAEIGALVYKPILFKNQYIGKHLHSTDTQLHSRIDKKNILLLTIHHFKWSNSTKAKLERRMEEEKKPVILGGINQKKLSRNISQIII